MKKLDVFDIFNMISLKVESREKKKLEYETI